MAVSPAQVREIARLARLALDDDEVRRYTRDLNAILEHVEAIAAVTGPDDAPERGEAGAAPLRPDEPGADPLQLPAAASAPDWRDGFFVVPRLAALGSDGALDRDGSPPR
jgi:aspartyl-tRNA(Asn)/glutamyl-tRNA(Gln) amidotransferase subunit C